MDPKLDPRKSNVINTFMHHHEFDADAEYARTRWVGRFHASEHFAKPIHKASQAWIAEHYQICLNMPST